MKCKHHNTVYMQLDYYPLCLDCGHVLVKATWTPWSHYYDIFETFWKLQSEYRTYVSRHHKRKQKYDV